jgi:hypothetical protein
MVLIQLLLRSFILYKYSILSAMTTFKDWFHSGNKFVRQRPNGIGLYKVCKELLPNMF